MFLTLATAFDKRERPSGSVLCHIEKSLGTTTENHTTSRGSRKRKWPMITAHIEMGQLRSRGVTAM